MKNEVFNVNERGKKHHSIRPSVATLKLNYFHEQLDLETSSSIFFS